MNIWRRAEFKIYMVWPFILSIGQSFMKILCSSWILKYYIGKMWRCNRRGNITKMTALGPEEVKMKGNRSLKKTKPSFGLWYKQSVNKNELRNWKMLIPSSVQEEIHFLAYCYQTSLFPRSMKTHRYLCAQYSILPHSHCGLVNPSQSNAVALTKLFLVYLIALLKVSASVKEIFIEFNGWPIPWFLKGQ